MSNIPKLISDNMTKNPIFSIFLFVIFTINSVSGQSSCPIDFSYVETVPWDTVLCRNPQGDNCCQALLSLIGVGLSQHLKETAMFQLPNVTASSSCLIDFQGKLTSLAIDPALVPLCFRNATQFVANRSSCGGIFGTEEWVEKVGVMTSLDTACRGDMSRLTRCSSCLDAGLQVTSQLVGMSSNESSKCFYFTCFYAAGIVNEFGPLDPETAGCILGLPLADDKGSGSSSRSKSLKIVFALLGAGIGVILIVGATVLYRRRKIGALHEEFVQSFKANVLPNSGAKWFQFVELETATNRFCQKNFIGQGAYGVVYKGTLTDGAVIAVKEMHDMDTRGDKEFTNEVEIISKIRHRNLLSLRGCCVTSNNWIGKRRFLVYDFMPNGSLSDHLYNEKSRKQLTWPQRKSIILDVAKGINYLHNGLEPAIYHRDIKPTNILLDMEMRAKVADFGLAKQWLDSQSHLTTRVAGTHGYLAPEYALYGQLTDKSDVYSFGIVILEIMSGRKVLDASNSSTILLVTDWAWTLSKSGDILQVFDESIREQGPKVVMERFIRVGILCAHVMVAFRPTIADALKMLQGDIDIPKLPDRPSPLSHEAIRFSPSHSRASTYEKSTASSSNMSRV